MFSWVTDYWYIPLFVLGCALGFIMSLLKRKPDLWPDTKLWVELDAIEAKRETRKVELLLGREKAKEFVESKYKSRMVLLNEQEKKRAKELENDPQMLAKVLERATRL